MKKIYVVGLILILSIGLFVPFSLADNEDSNIINLSDSKVTINQEEISTDENADVFLSTKMDNGGTSEESEELNVEIDNIINVNAPGTYEFSGTLSNGQIAINANEINGTVKIILNNVDITCSEAPAIFVYSKDIENENCEVVISTAENSENRLAGGKLKASVEELSDQEEILYYVDKGNDDDGTYYERYKYDGVISSDISLSFEGEGVLEIESLKKEGIESKMNLTFDGGTYIINSLDDGINACTDNESIITINSGMIVVNLQEDAEEGDGIDSNGSLYINGGTVYTFACPGSDNGLDSDNGTYINGGTVFSTGSMYEEAKTENDTSIVQMQLSSEVNEGDSIIIVDENNNPIFAYKADRKISTVVYTEEGLDDEEYSVYTGTDIEGTLGDYNIYLEIDSVNLEKLTKQENTGMAMREPGFNNEQPMQEENVQNMEKDNTELIIIISAVSVIGIIIVIMVIITLVKTKKEK